jgi:hypothetical protein
MLRRQDHQSSASDSGAESDLSSQEMWNVASNQLNAAMVLLLAQESAIEQGVSPSEKEKTAVLNKFAEAMYSFEILIERQENLAIVRPLAEGCRRLGEGLMNGDAYEYLEGRKLIVRTMLPIEEERDRRRNSSG